MLWLSCFAFGLGFVLYALFGCLRMEKKIQGNAWESRYPIYAVQTETVCAGDFYSVQVMEEQLVCTEQSHSSRALFFC